jgi:hypothetical protein
LRGQFGVVYLEVDVLVQHQLVVVLQLVVLLLETQVLLVALHLQRGGRSGRYWLRNEGLHFVEHLPEGSERVFTHVLIKVARQHSPVHYYNANVP